MNEFRDDFVRNIGDMYRHNEIIARGEMRVLLKTGGVDRKWESLVGVETTAVWRESVV